MGNKNNRPSKRLIIITTVIVVFAISLYILQAVVDSKLKEEGTEAITTEYEVTDETAE